MNQTQDPSADQAPHDTAPPRDPSGPRVTRDQMWDVERLRRSTTDKYAGGVAGGLARHFDIDPVIVRVLFVVGSIFGVGILVYGALWLLLPTDQGDRAAIDTAPDTRRVLVISTLVLAALMLFGGVFGDGWGLGAPAAILVLIVVGILASRRNREPRAERPLTSGYGTPQGVAYAPDGEDTRVLAEGTYAAPGGPTPPTSDAGTAQMYYPPQRPKRRGPILFWPTLALIALALGSLAIWDADHDVFPGAYAAIALGITGVMLVIGAFRGRAGGLPLLGLLLVPVLAVTTAFGSDLARSDNVTLRPQTAAELPLNHEIGSGRIEIDLTELDAKQIAELEGRTLRVSMNAGQILVILPPGLDYQADAALKFGGEIRVGDRVTNGLNPVLTTGTHTSDPAGTGTPSGTSTKPLLTLDLDGVAGSIMVRTNGVTR